MSSLMRDYVWEVLWSALSPFASFFPQLELKKDVH